MLEQFLLNYQMDRNKSLGIEIEYKIFTFLPFNNKFHREELFIYFIDFFQNYSHNYTRNLIKSITLI